MGKFIELHNSDGAILFNTDRITAVYAENDGSGVMYYDFAGSATRMRLKENYKEVRHMIAVAQGGIPMRRDRTVEGAPG